MKNKNARDARQKTRAASMYKQVSKVTCVKIQIFPGWDFKHLNILISKVMKILTSKNVLTGSAGDPHQYHNKQDQPGNERADGRRLSLKYFSITTEYLFLPSN